MPNKDSSANKEKSKKNRNEIDLQQLNARLFNIECSFQGI